ncbi:SAM domain-containing protein SAMSN-1 isoform X4 [Coregonus clupeaformis]|uniref:SAM domain-containing protein SAMSN-1 isoform X4 n=1 Tax=Coregonus clupeaformis TaxID=59861 RepID=UPI001BE0365D|nr:SAM domain-containing protein SAMSN-1 isoform X4 [Coregonus clupeaformis]
MLQRAASNVSDKPKLSKPKRSTSFGRFDGIRQPSPARLEENVTSVAEESGCEGSDQTKQGSLGKKMKAISLTMRRKMGKKHSKTFSAEAGEDTDRDLEEEKERGHPLEKGPEKTRNSLESLYSGQSSSSSGGVASVSDGSSTRDSLRLEEDGSYNGHFCGRARVHTDFVPSPYDTDSIKLKVGDIISIISKPPMGIWTGMLNNKVGNFKFIYVDVVMEKEREEEAPKIRPQRMSKRPRPKTLLELLERLHLEEYASALLLNGYQTVEDLRHLQEKHLIELNVMNPEHRGRLLAAVNCRYTESDDVRESEEPSSSHSLKEEKSDCPRDSGCFILSECSENIKEDTESQPVTH